MKLRLKDNTLRLRLSQPDLAQLQAQGQVTAHTRFGPGQVFTYRVEATPTAEALTAHYAADTLTVLLPAAWLAGWAESERVGFEATQPVGDGEALTLLVEKDFQCLHQRPEDEGAFPHPQAAVTSEPLAPSHGREDAWGHGGDAGS